MTTALKQLTERDAGLGDRLLRETILPMQKVKLKSTFLLLWFKNETFQNVQDTKHLRRRTRKSRLYDYKTIKTRRFHQQHMLFCADRCYNASERKTTTPVFPENEHRYLVK